MSNSSSRGEMDCGQRTPYFSKRVALFGLIIKSQSVPTRQTGVTMADGSVDWSGGVDSVKVTTIQSSNNPNGLARNQLAWLDNGTVRDGGITQRNGWQFLGTIHKGDAIYQRGYLYDPFNANPYL